MAERNPKGPGESSRRISLFKVVESPQRMGNVLGIGAPSCKSNEMSENDFKHVTDLIIPVLILV